jgi:hypothetical protein
VQQYAPVRVAKNPGPDGGLLLGASLRLISVGVLGLTAALGYGLWHRIASVPASTALSLNAEYSVPLIADGRDLVVEGPGPELASASATEYTDLPSSSRGAALLQRSKATIALASLTPADTLQRWARVPDPDAEIEDDELDGLPDPDEHTAIYDIAAHTVYLPDGRRLEAHSGLGRMLDDPRFVSIKHKGATPPNVYDLSLRERRFHGVRALRLSPVGAGRMFGRDGLLAHTYMLGPQGQSNGCVAFTDYPAFLNAYLSGEVTRLMVVDHLPAEANSKTAARRIPETVKALIGRS